MTARADYTWNTPAYCAAVSIASHCSGAQLIDIFPANMGYELAGPESSQERFTNIMLGTYEDRGWWIGGEN